MRIGKKLSKALAGIDLPHTCLRVNRRTGILGVSRKRAPLGSVLCHGAVPRQGG